MKIYHSISDFKNVSRPILTTGTFDGVHFGHKIIIDRLKEISNNQNGETVLLTFSPHPFNPVNCSATWNGCDKKRCTRLALETANLSSSESSSIPRIAIISCSSL